MNDAFRRPIGAKVRMVRKVRLSYIDTSKGLLGRRGVGVRSGLFY